MKYPITFWNEVKNQLLHIAIGFATAYTFFPNNKAKDQKLKLAENLTILGISGAIREYNQEKRGKEQPMWVHILDVVTIMLGGFLSWLLIKLKIIKPDEA